MQRHITGLEHRLGAIELLHGRRSSLDLARLNGDTWEVIEVGDGQVSGLRDMAPVRFYGELRLVLTAA